MKQFEIPYNFDPNLVISLKCLAMDETLIHCIYVPPIQNTYCAATRAIHTAQMLTDIDKETYVKHINLINEHFPNKVQLLLQRRDIIWDKEQLQFYLDLGITKFCVGTYEQAKILKEINKDFEVLGSITMKVQPKDLIMHLEYQNVFDGFILFYNYARDFELIQSLPRTYKYVLLVNCFCNLNCEGDHHWFMSPEEYLLKNGEIECPNNKYLNNQLSVPWEESCLIRPQDLVLFNPYISYYKIQGREYPTGTILQHFLSYMGENTNYYQMFDNTMLPNINLYLKKKE